MISKVRVSLLLVAMGMLLLGVHQGYFSDNSLFEPEIQRDLPFRSVYTSANKSLFDFVQTTKPPWIATKNGHDIYLPNLNITNPLDLPTPLPFVNRTKNPCFYDSHDTLLCFPYFFILAPQKCGTTDLFHLLGQHKDIAALRSKEPHWFDRGRFGGYPKSGRNPKSIAKATPLKSYLNNFPLKINENSSAQLPLIVGDGSASTIYDQLFWRSIPENKDKTEPSILSAHEIHHFLPNAKFISILRNPTTRLLSDYSFYASLARRRATEEEFTRKVKSGIQWINACFANESIPNRTCLYDKPEVTSNKWHPDVSWHPVVRIRAGLYSLLLKDWFSVFPREQFFFSTLEHYSKHRVSVLNDIFKFLGVSKTNKIGRGSKRSNKHRKIKISNETMQLIDEFYRPYNEQLAMMLHDRKYNW